MGLKNILIIVMAFAISCAQRSRRDDTKLNPTPKGGTKGSVFNLSADQANVSVLMTDVSVENWGKSYKLPHLKLNYQGSDFVRILRCDESYLEYFTALYEPAKASSHKDHLKQLWLNSFGANNFCRISTNFNRASDYYDINAKNGKFFYIVNPCVSATRADNGIEGCSYQLAASPIIEFQDAISNSFQNLAAKLSDAEATYDAHLTNLLNLAAKLDLAKETCNDALYARETMNNAALRNWTIINGVAAAGAGLGARALLSKKANSLSQFGRFGISAMVFSAAFGILSAIQAGAAKKDASIPQACDEAEKVTSDLLMMRDEKPTLEDLEKKLIQISTQMQEIEDQFVGYTQATFTLSK